MLLCIVTAANSSCPSDGDEWQQLVFWLALVAAITIYKIVKLRIVTYYKIVKLQFPPHDEGEEEE